MDEYETEPTVIFQRADGSSIRLYKSKTDPFRFLPIEDDKTVTDWTERFLDAAK